MKPGLHAMAESIIEIFSPDNLRYSIEQSRLWASEPELLRLIHEGLVGKGITTEEANRFIRSIHALAGTVLH
jgi:hypothetical protein